MEPGSIVVSPYFAVVELVHIIFRGLLCFWRSAVFGVLGGPALRTTRKHVERYFVHPISHPSLEGHQPFSSSACNCSVIVYWC